MNMTNVLAHVVIADDDEDDYEMLNIALKQSLPHVKIHYVKNGIKLMMLLNRIEADAIFLDINMPVKDGIECLKEIRENEKKKKTRVVMYSTSDNDLDIDKSFKEGANYFLVKPDSEERLTNTIARLLTDTKFISNTLPAKDEFVMN
jgi:PleD family two-component response regulator